MVPKLCSSCCILASNTGVPSPLAAGTDPADGGTAVVDGSTAPFTVDGALLVGTAPAASAASVASVASLDGSNDGSRISRRLGNSDASTTSFPQLVFEIREEDDDDDDDDASITVAMCIESRDALLRCCCNPSPSAGTDDDDDDDGGGCNTSLILAYLGDGAIDPMDSESPT